MLSIEEVARKLEFGEFDVIDRFELAKAWRVLFPNWPSQNEPIFKLSPKRP